jgi:hypothetical protein
MVESRPFVQRLKIHCIEISSSSFKKKVRFIKVALPTPVSAAILTSGTPARVARLPSIIRRLSCSRFQFDPFNGSLCEFTEHGMIDAAVLPMARNSEEATNPDLSQSRLSPFNDR